VRGLGPKEQAEQLQAQSPYGYELLTEFEDPLGVKFAEAKELHDKLGRRNDSILAHGLKPVDKNTFDILWKYAQSLALIAIEDLETLEKTAKSPTIDLW